MKVCLLYDGIGSCILNEAYINKKLHDAGVETGCFSPPLIAFIVKRLNYRNHRKILVVNGKTGFFGGLNIGDEYAGKNSKIGFWRDTHYSIKGEADTRLVQYASLSYVEELLQAGVRFFNIKEDLSMPK